MEIFFGVLTVLSLIICIVLVIDLTVFRYSLKEITTGMTGEEIQNIIKRKLRIIQVRGGNSYIAIATSRTTVFKCRFIFVNGKLMNKSM